MPTPTGSSAVQSAVKKVLVVGATGQLGGSIVRGLRARDIAVRGMVRSSEKAAELENLGCETVRADVRDRASLDAACRDVSHVVTTANAFLGRGAMDPKYVDLQGTRNLIDASVAQGVDRFIYTCSLSRCCRHWMKG